MAAFALPIAGMATSLIGGILGSKAAQNAKDAQVQGLRNAKSDVTAGRDQALNTQRDVYSAEKNVLSPYQDAGTASLKQLTAGTAPGGQFNSTPTGDQILAQDPGYAARLKEGTQALERAQAAGGRVGSGGALKEATRYGQDYASNEYGAAFGRYNTMRQENYSNLANLANFGQTANGQFLNASENYGNQSGSYDVNAAKENAQSDASIGDAEAAGAIGSASAWSGALSGIAKSATGLPGMSGASNSPSSSSSSSGYSDAIPGLQMSDMPNANRYASLGDLSKGFDDMGNFVGVR
jgi:hypothetical protein